MTIDDSDDAPLTKAKKEKTLRMKHILITFAILAAATTLFAEKPNVLIIFTDDQGSVDMNAYGAKDLVTPHMDQLAREGVRFTQFYAAGPVRVPSRVGLLTGRIPQRGGLDGSGPLGEQVMISEEMKKAGYATGAFWQMASQSWPRCATQ